MGDESKTPFLWCFRVQPQTVYGSRSGTYVDQAATTAIVVHRLASFVNVRRAKPIRMSVKNGSPQCCGVKCYTKIVYEFLKVNKNKIFLVVSGLNPPKVPAGDLGLDLSARCCDSYPTVLDTS